jgi:predicted PurR-regulated permease PerM
MASASKKHMTAFMTVVASILLLALAGYIIAPYIKDQIEELFGAQGGELVQLQTSHVPTLYDVQGMEEARKRVKKEMIDMTGYW